MSDRVYVSEEVTVVEIDETHVEVVSVGIQGPVGPPGDQGPQGDPATNLVTSVAGKQGVVTLSKDDVGLSAVDNTSDSSKPVSTAQQAALTAKMDFPLTNSNVAVRGSTGNQASLPYSVGALSTSIPLRASAGTIETATPTIAAHATTKAYVDAGLALQVSKAGDTMTGVLNNTDSSAPAYTQTRGGKNIRFGTSSTGHFATFNQTDSTEMFYALNDGSGIALGNFTGGVRYLKGSGFPNGVVTAPVGSIYIDSAVTNGASSWIKKSGTGNTGWAVLEGDTGWRRLETYINKNYFSASVLTTQYLLIRRVGSMVELSGRLEAIASTTSTAVGVLTGPGMHALIGFKSVNMYPAIITVSAVSGWTIPAQAMMRSAIGRGATSSDTSGFEAAQFTSGQNISAPFTWTTADDWPTTLPGTAA